MSPRLKHALDYGVALARVAESEVDFGMAPGQLERLKQDVKRGAARFWAKRGLPEPGGEDFGSYSFGHGGRGGE